MLNAQCSKGMYEKVLQFMEKHKISPKESIEIGKWCAKQRKKYKCGKLSAEEIQRMQALPGWRWDKKDERWHYCYELTRVFLKTHGVRPILTTPIIGQWGFKQRELYAQGKLSAYRIKKLEEIGFNWTRKNTDHYERLWEARYQKLCACLKKCENTQALPASVMAWCKYQCQKRENGELSAHRVAKLDAIGFTWTGSVHEELWDKRYTELCEFLSKYKRMPPFYMSLNHWCSTQRQAYSKGKLSQDRVDKLNAIGFQWKGKLGKKEKFVAEF